MSKFVFLYIVFSIIDDNMMSVYEQAQLAVVHTEYIIQIFIGLEKPQSQNNGVSTGQLSLMDP